MVCPYNKRAPLHTNPKFDPLYDPTALDGEAWLRMSEEEFEAMAGTTAMTRAGLKRIQKNIEAE